MKDILLVHLGRSGSTVLGNLLGQLPEIQWHGEIFTKANQQGKKFLSEKELLDFYDEHSRFSDMHNGIEIKLINFLAAGARKKSSIESVQEFLKFVENLTETRDIYPVLLLRENILKRLVSVHSAAKSGVWHLKFCSKGKSSGSIELPIERLDDWAAGFKGEINEVLDNGEKVNDALRNFFQLKKWQFLVYEKDLAQNPVQGATDLAHHILGRHIEANEFLVNFKKTSSGNVSDNVLNFDSVLNAINFEYQWMVV